MVFVVTQSESSLELFVQRIFYQKCLEYDDNKYCLYDTDVFLLDQYLEADFASLSLNQNDLETTEGYSQRSHNQLHHQIEVLSKQSIWSLDLQWSYKWKINESDAEVPNLAQNKSTTPYHKAIILSPRRIFFLG